MTGFLPVSGARAGVQTLSARQFSSMTWSIVIAGPTSAWISGKANSPIVAFLFWGQAGLSSNESRTSDYRRRGRGGSKSRLPVTGAP